MKVGFTGTQRGMEGKQQDRLLEILSSIKLLEFHHGDCIGADDQAHYLIGKYLKSKDICIVIHPPSDFKKRAWCKGSRIEREVKPYLERNKDIVDETDLLIACPKSDKEELRSGTWSTIRYARKQNKKVVLIYPNGDIKGG